MEYAAEDLGANYIATGHYVRRRDADNQAELLRGLDSNKDQSYFLYTLSKNQVGQSLFPVGEIEKPIVRAIAEDLGLITAKKKDSTGICFIGERRFREFLSNYLPMKSGDIIDVTTKQKVGTHQGVMYYTIGQRKGLILVVLVHSLLLEKMFIEMNYMLLMQIIRTYYTLHSCLVTGINWLADRTLPMHCHAKFRYRQADNDVELC